MPPVHLEVPTGARGGSQGVNRAVLVVDDDASVARLVGAVLAREGLAAELAPDGAAALQRLQAGGIAMVLTDMTMPGMSGLELVREAEARGLTAPFLLMSAFLDVHTERTLFAEPGIVGVLRKPFELTRLVADVKTLLAAATRSDAPSAGGPRSSGDSSAEAAVSLALVPQWIFRTWPGTPPSYGTRTEVCTQATALVPGQKVATATAMAAASAPAPLAPC